eukprot:3010782-Amphidinium_carterae.2
MKGKARGQRKGQGKGKRGDNNKGKDGKAVTCYTCSKQGHTSTTCYHNKGKNGKGQNKSYQQQSHYSQQPGRGEAIHNSHRIKGYNKGYGKQWNKGGKKGHKFQYIKSMTMTTTMKRTHTRGTIFGIRIQEWYPEGDINQQWSGQEVGQVLQQPQSGDSTTSPQTMGNFYEIGSLTTAFITLIDTHLDT